MRAFVPFSREKKEPKKSFNRETAFRSGYDYQGVISVWSILAKIQKAFGKSLCFIYSVFFFISAFGFIGLISFDFWDNSGKGIYVFAFFVSLICGIMHLFAGLYDPDRDESITVKPKPLIFSTMDENGKIIKKEFSPPPPLECTEIHRTDDKVDFFIQIHSEEQAKEVLAALAVMYDRGDIIADDYHDDVRKIREHFDL